MVLPVHAPRVVITAPAEATTPASLTDEQLAAAAVQSHDQAVAMRDGAVEAAVRTGDLLREAQRRCRDRGQAWGDWLLRHWPKSRKTAERYINLSHAHEQADESPQLQQNSASRVTSHPSVRAALEAIGYGVERDEPEPPAETDDAVIERLRGEAEAKPEPAAESKPTRWAPPRGGLAGAPGAKLTPEEIARRAALHKQKADEDAAAEAQAKADRDAIKAAEDRDPLKGPPPPPPPKPQPAPREPQSRAEDLRRIAGLFEQGRRELLLVTLDVPTPSTAKGLGDAQNSFAPLVERYTLLLRQVADEDHEAVTYEVDQRAKKNRKRGA